jgi:hypothetical protein
MKLIAIIASLVLCSSVLAAHPIKHPYPSEVSGISRLEVMWMYSLKTRFWKDGTKITVFYLNYDNPTHVDFVKNVLGVSPERFKNSVETYINAGNASYFRRAETEAEVYNQVSRIPGSIGYVSDKIMLINVGGNSVRTVPIID